METIAVDSFGGIFKFVCTKKARDAFLEARRLVSEKSLPRAVEEFIRCKELCNIEEDIKTVDVVLEEIERYLKYKIPVTIARTDSVEWTAVIKRKLERLEEDLDRIPQGFFMVKFTPRSGLPFMVLGRKTLSNLWLDNSIPEIFCSQIRAEMFLGFLQDWRVTDSKLIVYFNAITDSEKLVVFEDIVSSNGKGCDITFPFPLVKTITRKEFTSPAEGWDVDTSFDHTLSSGEEHIRQVTVDVLNNFGFTSHRLYDPACSTGVFLNSLKQAFPQCRTIGQDLSQKMCEVAKSRVDEVHCGSAINPMIPAGSAHCVFVRFLNSEVVTTVEADLLLHALLPTVAAGGIVITFGHTPVLLSASSFLSLDNFELISCVAVARDRSSIFQYYVIKRIA